MFENFKAYDDECKHTEDWGDTIYLMIPNEIGRKEAIQWLTDTGNYYETQLMGNEENHYYKYNDCRGVYEPIDDIPDKLITDFNCYFPQESKNETFQKFKIKIQLINGVTVEPNLYSNNLYEIASVIQTFSSEKLFAGQVKNINIELS